MRIVRRLVAATALDDAAVIGKTHAGHPLTAQQIREPRSSLRTPVRLPSMDGCRRPRPRPRPEWAHGMGYAASRAVLQRASMGNSQRRLCPGAVRLLVRRRPGPRATPRAHRVSMQDVRRGDAGAGVQRPDSQNRLGGESQPLDGAPVSHQPGKRGRSAGLTLCWPAWAPPTRSSLDPRLRRPRQAGPRHVYKDHHPRVGSNWGAPRPQLITANASHR